MTTPVPLPRSELLREWMSQYGITDAAIAKQLGLSLQRVNIMLRQETMPTIHHASLLSLGFPLHLLPTPYDKPRGPRPKQPNFPGLMAAQLEV